MLRTPLFQYRTRHIGGLIQYETSLKPAALDAVNTPLNSTHRRGGKGAGGGGEEGGGDGGVLRWSPRAPYASSGPAPAHRVHTPSQYCAWHVECVAAGTGHGVAAYARLVPDSA
eukprot:1506463-Rhodomonas_salina.1